MRIAVITTIHYPSTLANRLHILSMSNAFARAGHKVKLFCRQVSNYSLEDNVSISSIASDRSLVSAWNIAKSLKADPYEVWFIREPHLLLFVLLISILFRVPKQFVVYEVHDMPRDWLDKMALLMLKQYSYIIVTITKTLAADVANIGKIPKESILILPDGVDLEKFVSSQSKTEAREKIGYSNSKPLIMYTGNLYGWKGIFILAEAARLLPNAQIYFVGGKKTEVDELHATTKDMSNVNLVGHVPHEQISSYLKAADILVLPNSATYKMSEHYTSPLKLFEYMASQRPIVASDLPSIGEILIDEKNAYLVTPDDPVALADKINQVLSDQQNDVIVARAFIDVKKYTWDSRVKEIKRILDKNYERVVD